MTLEAVELDPRRQARLEQRRRRLLQAALALFAEQGFHPTSVEDVVGLARMSKSAFYEFFQSKEDCFCALLEQEGGAVIHAVVQGAAEGSDHRDRMCRGIRAFVQACSGSIPAARMMVVESVGLTPRVEELRRNLQSRFSNMVAEEVRRAAAHGDSFYAAVDPDVFGRSVVGAVNEAVGHHLAGSGGDLQAVADSLCRIFAPQPA